MSLPVTAFTGANGLVELKRRDLVSLANYIEDFIKHKQHKLGHYIQSDFVTIITEVGKEEKKIQEQLDKIVLYELFDTKTPYIYQLDVVYEKSSHLAMNDLLKVICKRRGVEILQRGKRCADGYRFSVLIDVAKGGDLTNGVARLARLVYFLNTI